MHEVQKDTICQYTGFKDANGNKIYEKDIISFYGNVGEVIDLFYIKFDESTSYREDLEFWGTYRKKEIEVIGNIFDNLELLEQ